MSSSPPRSRSSSRKPSPRRIPRGVGGSPGERGRSPVRRGSGNGDLRTAEGRASLLEAAGRLSTAAEVKAMMDGLQADAKTSYGSSKTEWPQEVQKFWMALMGRRRALTEQSTPPEPTDQIRTKRDGSPARVAPAPESDHKLQSAWSDIVKGANRQRVITQELGRTQDWPDISTTDKAALVDGVCAALQHLSRSRTPVIRSIMHVAALATRALYKPTSNSLSIEVTDPIRVGDMVALGRANPLTVEISPYKPLRSHPAQSLDEASETLVHELTHWVSFEVYGGGQDGNPPWITGARLRRHKEDGNEENGRRKETVAKAIERLDEVLGGDALNDLMILQRVLAYQAEVRYKELLPHVVELAAHLENNGDEHSIGELLDAGGLGVVRQALEQFEKDLKRFQVKLAEKEKHYAKENWGPWQKVDVTKWW